VNPAAEPRAAGEVRLLVVDGESGALSAHAARSLPELLAPGDLLVVNDAATLPARDARGAFVELRLVGALEPGGSGVSFRAALLGAGDHRTRTEDRAPPPRVVVGDVLSVGGELEARVVAVASFSERLVDLALTTPASSEPSAVWSALYRLGKPVQYAHVPRPLALWDVQNAWAGRPWAVEMPSAGRAIGIGTLLALRRRGVEIATVTHAAGLSATGDPAIDARLPFPERFEVPEATVRAILRTRARGRRVVAVGTSVTRALESAAARAGEGRLRAAAGTTDLLLGPHTQLAVVDGLVTGVHESDTTHFQLLGAFAEREVLEASLAATEHAGFLGHELGDTWLVWRDPLRGARSATFAA
jgi:S-adenosylmethionine:tRNA ribosyltransferase-isomerase